MNSILMQLVTFGLGFFMCMYFVGSDKDGTFNNTCKALANWINKKEKKKSSNPK